MRVKEFDGSKSRRILIGMIVHDTVCGRIAGKWTKGGLFKSPLENIIGGWCVEFYNRYGKAPRRSIEGIYEAWAADTKDKATTKLVDSLLREISGEYSRIRQEINPEHLIDQAGTYFNRIAVERFREALGGDLELGKVKNALKRIHEFGEVEIGEEQSYVDFLNDKEAIKDVFSHKVESIVEYPGALGEFFGDELCRDAFIYFEAPPGRGKSWWLLDLVWRAMTQRRKTAYFQIGDMSRRQVLNRLCVRAARHPRKARSIVLPRKIRRDEDGGFTVKRIEKEFTKPLNFKKAWKAIQDVAENEVKSNQAYLRLSVHAAKTLTVQGMRTILREWERKDKWHPDVVVIDYVDLFKPPTGFSESRDAVNDNWVGLRQASQELHCLLVTASQTKATAYKKDTIGMEDFSEDNRKNAHVTGKIGINQTEEEKAEGIFRLGWAKIREDENPDTRYVYTAGCLAIANPAIVSISAIDAAKNSGKNNLDAKRRN